MKTAGIIAEYNPLHNGHLHHIQETRQAGFDRIVVVLSSQVVQRAEPAFFSKWTRAAAAIRCGADLVVELPAPWAMASAERFAAGGVALMAGMGCVDALSFGSEAGDAAALSRCAESCLEAEAGSRILELLDEGKSYAAAREAAVAELAGEETAALLRRPNNILGVEYLKAIRRLAPEMQVVTIPRKGPGHDSTARQGGLASASALRELIQFQGFGAAVPFIPPEAAVLFYEDIRTRMAPASMERLETAVLYRLRTMSLEEMRALPSVSEGLEQRLYKLSRTPMPLSELINRLRTRRYPLSRVRRILYEAMLGLDAAVYDQTPPYIRVLAFNENGKNLLRKIKKSGTLPVYHSFARLERDYPHLAAIELLATDLFRYACPALGNAHSEYQDRRPYAVVDR